MVIKKAAKKALLKMPSKTAQAFYTAFLKIEAGDAEGLDIKTLNGREGFRLRIGQYRAIYTVALEVVVITAGPRGAVYK